MFGSTVNEEEVNKFSKIADEWWDGDGKFKALHKFNPVRVDFIRDKLVGYFDLKQDSLEGLRLLDVGCGGGFPGIPLAILFPESTFHLVDSIGKKIKVVTEVANAIGLTNLTAQHERAEKINDKYHFIVSRAVTAFPEFYNWISKKILKENFNDLPNGILYLKGGDLREEFGKHYDKAVFYDLRNYFEEEFFETKKVVYYKL